LDQLALMLVIIFYETVSDVTGGGIARLSHLHVVDVLSLVYSLALLGVQ
jgi:hypothetical protein